MAKIWPHPVLLQRRQRQPRLRSCGPGNLLPARGTPNEWSILKFFQAKPSTSASWLAQICHSCVLTSHNITTTLYHYLKKIGRHWSSNLSWHARKGRGWNCHPQSSNSISASDRPDAVHMSYISSYYVVTLLHSCDKPSHFSMPSSSTFRNHISTSKEGALRVALYSPV